MTWQRWLETSTVFIVFKQEQDWTKSIDFKQLVLKRKFFPSGTFPFSQFSWKDPRLTQKREQKRINQFAIWKQESYIQLCDATVIQSLSDFAQIEQWIVDFQLLRPTHKLFLSSKFGLPLKPVLLEAALHPIAAFKVPAASPTQVSPFLTSTAPYLTLRTSQTSRFYIRSITNNEGEYLLYHHDVWLQTLMYCLTCSCFHSTIVNNINHKKLHCIHHAVILMLQNSALNIHSRHT